MKTAIRRMIFCLEGFDAAPRRAQFQDNYGKHGGRPETSQIIICWPGCSDCVGKAASKYRLFAIREAEEPIRRDEIRVTFEPARRFVDPTAVGILSGNEMLAEI